MKPDSPCWFVAGITITDPAEYALYLKDAAKVFAQFKGRYLAVDKAPVRLEGDWLPGRIVIIEFPNRDELDRWHFSADYQALLQHRLRGAECRGFVVSSQP